MAAGVQVVLASGRSYIGMRRYIRELSLHKTRGCVICGNGALTQEAATGKITAHATLPAGPATAAFNLADAEGFAVQISEGDAVYVSRENEFTAIDMKLTGVRQLVPADFKSLIADNCHKLVIPGDPVLLRPLEVILRNFSGAELTVFTSKPYYLEILPPETDKGTALANLAAKLGIEQDEVMAFGDSMNDEAMVRWAGCGVAMKNGDERIKEIARLVTERSNDEDGVARVIESYVLTQR
jgi:Cof subfamily protein (haloacid dehalogenase superfamily)